MRSRLDPSPRALARFRPTPRQAGARGAYAGALVTVAGSVLAALAALGLDAWLDWRWAIALLLPMPAGALVTLVTGRSDGVDADDLGLHRVPTLPPPWPPPLSPWSRITDIRAERHGSRTVVAVYLDTGVVSRLPAPYDGRLLAHDPRFEWKLFAMRNLWETHRSWGGA